MKSLAARQAKTPAQAVWYDGNNKYQYNGSNNSPPFKYCGQDMFKPEYAKRQHESDRDDDGLHIGFAEMSFQCHAGNRYKENQDEREINPFGILGKDLGGFDLVEWEKQ